VNHLNPQNTSVSPDGQVRYDVFRLLGDLNGDGAVTSADVVLERNQISDYVAIRKLLGHALPPKT
jgi:hypothetical protein